MRQRSTSRVSARSTPQRHVRDDGDSVSLPLPSPQLAHLLKGMEQGLCLVGHDQVVQYANTWMAEKAGGEALDLVGRRLSDLLVGADAPQLELCLREGDESPLECRLRQSDGPAFWVALRFQPVPPDCTTTPATFVWITDIEHRKRAEFALQEAEERLEQWVAERTEDLIRTNKTLQREITQHRETESALRRNRERFRDLYENAPVAYIAYDAEGRLQMGNQSARILLGYSDGSLEGVTLEDLFLSSDDPDNTRHLCHTLLNGEGLRDVEAQVLTRDGSRVWVRLSTRALIGETGTILSRLITMQDISRRKAAEEALRRAQTSLEKRVIERTARLMRSNVELKEQIGRRREFETRLKQSEKRYRELFNTVQDAVLVHVAGPDVESAPFIEVNDIACRLLGYSREDYLGLNPLALVPDAARPAMREWIGRVLGGNRMLSEMDLVARDGERITVEVNAQALALEGQTVVIWVARDIRERRRAERQIRNQAALLDKAQDAILVQDLDNRITYWNESAARLYGYRADEASGQDIRTLVFGGETAAFHDARETTLAGGEWTGELVQFTRSGDRIIVESRWTRVVGESEAEAAILVVNTDITDRKRLESQFLRAQRLESIGTLAGGIAHDLNNVLAPILLATQVMGAKTLDAKTGRLVAMIEQNVNRGTDMIRQVLTFARGIEGEKVIVQPRHIVKDVLKILKETFPRSISVHSRLAKELWTVSADPTQLHQVLLNLCVNARDAMPDGGVLHISAANVTMEAEQLPPESALPPGPAVLIRVRDSGTGIPQTILDKIFDPFFTTKPPGKGTGLGLSTVLAIVKAHSGMVDVDTDSEKGTEFRVYLKALPSAEVTESDAVDIDQYRGSGQRILVVDDEASVREMTRETLECYGYRVEVAANGADAVARYLSLEDSVDLVLLDMMMPVMDGPATIGALRSITPDVRIIAASGLSQNARPRELRERGIAAFLNKPFTAERLLMTMHNVLAGTGGNSHPPGDD